MILDLVFTGALVSLILFSRLLPLETRHDFLCLTGIVGLFLYAPMVALVLLGFAILGTHLWLRRRGHFFDGFWGIWCIWVFLILVLPVEPILISRFDPLYLLHYNLQRILYFIFEDYKGKMRTSTLSSFWHYSFLMPLQLGTVEWFHDYYTAYKKRVLPILWKDGLMGLGRAFLKCYTAAFLTVYLVEPLFVSQSLSLILVSAVCIGVSFTLNVWGTFDLARALMAFLGFRLDRKIFGSIWKAKSVVEFWSNWNIPVVVFIREYIFIPFMTLFSRGVPMLKLLYSPFI
jgi:hypothetical protein